MLQHRMRCMLAAGRHVVLAGDLNIALQPEDHCDYLDAAPPEQRAFTRRRPDRVLLRSMTKSGGGPLHDLLRHFHPSRRYAYTVWPTK